ncbi:MAG: DnaD domain protein [Oscillospiraceae bacterium]|nr:DnaD domain protein [Oscillospiraceae bacterium]
MKSDDRKKLLLSDTAVPDLFISDYMPGLSGISVQIYLYFLMASGKGYAIGEKDIASRLSVAIQDVKGALAELALAGLIDRDERGKLKVSDIKVAEVERYIQRSSREEVKENEPISPLNEAREKLAGSIESTFFHGSMAYQWYREIDTLLFEFGFDPDVIYALFQQLYKDNQLTSVSKIKYMAVQWHGKGICTAKDLDAYLMREETVAVTLRKLGKRLRKKMTGFDEDTIRLWIEKLAYPYEVMEYAIQKVCEYSAVPSMKRANDLLMTWYAAGIKTLDEAKSFENEQAKLNSARYRSEKATDLKSGAGNIKQNFAGVTYTEEELHRFEDDPNELMERYAREPSDPGPR